MITDENARELVRTLRGIAKRNLEEREQGNEYWKGQSDSRCGAYNLSADWLEALIPVPDMAEVEQ